MQRERANRAQVPRTFARLNQRRADTRTAWARPPSGVTDRLGSVSATVRPLVPSAPPTWLRAETSEVWVRLWRA
jgi:hypothetical protein